MNTLHLLGACCIAAAASSCAPRVVETLPATPGPQRPAPAFVAEDDDNDSPAEAVVLALDDPRGAQGVIQVPGDHDFYAVDIATPQALRIAIVANFTTRIPGTLDAYVRVTAPDGTILAEVDDDLSQSAPFPIVAVDPVAYAALPAGRIGIEVLAAGELFGQPSGDGSFAYSILAETPRSSGAFGADVEPNERPADAPTVVVGAQGLLDLVGSFAGVALLEGAADVDFFRLALDDTPPNTILSIIARPAFPGAPVAQLRFVDATGAVLSSGSHAWPTDREVFVEVSTGPAATQAPFTAEWQAFPNAVAVEAEPRGTSGANDELATAEPLAEPARAVRSDLAAEGDVDRFALPPTLARFDVQCRSRTEGSGVLGLTLEVRDEADAIVGAGVETAEPVVVEVDGTPPFQIRIAKEGQDVLVPGGLVSCFTVNGGAP